MLNNFLHNLSFDQVFVVDNYFTGRKRNIEQWVGHENFELLHHDIGKVTFFQLYVMG